MDIGAVKSLIKKHGLSSVNKAKLESIVDNATSKYIDIGTVRMQWGRGGSGTSTPTITFPAPFKDTLYTFVCMINGNASNEYTVTQGTKTVQTIALEKRFSGGGASGESLDWIAIGARP